MQHLRWEKTGRLFSHADKGNPNQFTWKSSIGQRNVDVGNGQFAPYVWDQQKRIVKFGECELRFTTSGLEFWHGIEKLNTLSFNPEYKQGLNWRRRVPSTGSLSIQEIDTGNSKVELKLSYLLKTSDSETEVFVRVGYNHKVHFGTRFKSLISGVEQRVALEFAEKFDPVEQRDSKQNVLPTSRLKTAKSWWAWNQSEQVDHEIEQSTITKVCLGRKVYTLNEEKVVSPDTWGTDVGIASSADDGWTVDTLTDYWRPDNDTYYVGDGTTYKFGLGLRWDGITIAKNSAINSCLIDVFDVEGWGAPSTECSIKAWAHDDAPQYDQTNYPWVLTGTTAHVHWTPVHSTGWKTLPDLSSIVAEIVGRAGWISGNAINFWALPDSVDDCARGYEDYQAAGTNEAELTITYTAPASATIDQEGFRFRNDDGDQANATWAADQDANLTAPLVTNLRLRFIRNANGDPASTPFRIEYSIDGNNYSAVPLPSNGTQSNNFTANNTWTCPTGVNSVVVECWGAGGAGGGRTANGAGGGGGGGAAAWNTVAVVAGTNYTVQVGPEVAGGTGAGGHGVNSFFALASNNLVYCLAEGGNGGTSAANGVGGVGGATNNCVGSNKFKGGNGGPGYNASGNYGGGGGGGAGNNAAGTDASNQVGAAGGNALGGAGGNGAAAGAAGNTGLVYGGGGGGAKRRAASGSYSGGNGAAGLVRLIYTPVLPIVLANSVNIAAGGNTNTTGQLTAPANKNANNFEAGRISDDTNPLATIDMGANYYSEDEWCLMAQAPAANNEIYYFRVTSNGVAFNSYNAVPQWTIGVVASNNKSCNLTDSGGGADGIGGISVMASMADNGIGADATPIGALIPTMSDNGAGADLLASLLASLSMQDSTSGADILSSLLANINLTDSASATDALQIALLTSLSDSGLGSDVIMAILNSAGLVDTGTSSDLISPILSSLGIQDAGLGVDELGALLANLTITDAATAADLIQAFFLVSLLDSATGSDLVNAIAASIGIPDTGAGVDALSSVGVALGLSDTASGADIISTLMASLTISDIGTAIDVIQAFFLVTLYDAGVGIDQINNLANSLGISDVGTFIDEVIFFTTQALQNAYWNSLYWQPNFWMQDYWQELGGAVSVMILDTGAAQDLISSVFASLSVPDAGSALDSAQTLILISTTDSATGVDSVYQVLVQSTIADSGAGLETPSVRVVLAVSDSVSGLDSPTVLATINLSDSGAGVDLIDVIKQAIISILDAGVGADQISSIQVFVPVSDAGSGVDVLPLLQAALSIVDLGAGIDVAINLTLLGSYNRLVVTFQGKGAGLAMAGQKGRTRFAPKRPGTRFAPKKGRIKWTPKKPGTEFIN